MGHVADVDVVPEPRLPRAGGRDVLRVSLQLFRSPDPCRAAPDGVDAVRAPEPLQHHLAGHLREDVGLGNATGVIVVDRQVAIGGGAALHGHHRAGLDQFLDARFRRRGQQVVEAEHVDPHRGVERQSAAVAVRPVGGVGNGPQRDDRLRLAGGNHPPAVREVGQVGGHERQVRAPVGRRPQVGQHHLVIGKLVRNIAREPAAASGDQHVHGCCPSPGQRPDRPAASYRLP